MITAKRLGSVYDSPNHIHYYQLTTYIVQITLGPISQFFFSCPTLCFICHWHLGNCYLLSITNFHQTAQVQRSTPNGQKFDCSTL